MYLIYRICLLIIFCVLPGLILNAHAEEGKITFHLIRIEHEKMSCTPRSEISEGGELYECFNKMDFDYSMSKETGSLLVTKENAYYWVNKKVELDNNDFRDAKILSLGWDPISRKQKEIDVESIQGQYDEEYESNDPVRGFRLRVLLNEEGKRIVQNLRKNHVGADLAIIFEGKLFMVEPIHEEMTDRDLVVKGLLYKEARSLKDSILNP